MSIYSLFCIPDLLVGKTPTQACGGMEEGMKWNTFFYGMLYGRYQVWNEMEDFQNGVECNVPHFHANSNLIFDFHFVSAEVQMHEWIAIFANIGRLFFLPTGTLISLGRKNLEIKKKEGSQKFWSNFTMSARLRSGWGLAESSGWSQSGSSAPQPLGKCWHISANITPLMINFD